MWVEKLQSGKYKFIERYKDYQTGKEKKVSVTLEKNNASTRKMAAQMLVELIDKRQTTPAESKELTLKELVEKYRAYQKRTVKESTYSRNYYQANAILAILGEDTLISRITANYVKDRFLSTGESFSRLNERRTRFRALINWGYENDYLKDVSFLKKIKPFSDKPHKLKIQGKYLEDYELKELLDGMEHERWKLFTELLVLSGLRVGEAIALTHTDVDFENQCLHITKTYDFNNKLVTPPKTFCSIRDVYMQPELFKLCKKINTFMKTESLLNGYRTELFFCNTTGDYITYATFNKYLGRKSERIIGRKLTTHALRHTHASLLLANGVSIETISRRLGHENSKVTKEIYLHATEKLTQSDNEQIRDLKII